MFAANPAFLTSSLPRRAFLGAAFSFFSSAISHSCFDRPSGPREVDQHCIKTLETPKGPGQLPGPRESLACLPAAPSGATKGARFLPQTPRLVNQRVAALAEPLPGIPVRP